MRITNKMITSNYLSNLSSLTSDLNTLNTKVSTGRSFLKSSEDAASAVRAYNIRTQLAKNDVYQENIKYADSSLTNAESSLDEVNTVVQEANEKILEAANGTNSQDERKIIAQELSILQQELLSALNSSSSDTYNFGGTNTSTEPFTVDTDGTLLYNGIDLDLVSDDAAVLAANPTYTDLSTLSSDSRYIDIGLNLSFTETTDALGNTVTSVDKSTVFSYSIPGINITGYGTTTLADGTTTSNNLYNLMGSIITELESDTYTYDKLDELNGLFSTATENVINSITVVGAKSSYLEFMTDRLTTQELNLTELQTAVEGADPAETIVDYTAQQLAYEAALQMGVSLLQPSIFDYMS